MQHGENASETVPFAAIDAICSEERQGSSFSVCDSGESVDVLGLQSPPRDVLSVSASAGVLGGAHAASAASAATAVSPVSKFSHSTTAVIVANALLDAPVDSSIKHSTPSPLPPPPPPLRTPLSPLPSALLSLPLTPAECIELWMTDSETLQGACLPACDSSPVSTLISPSPSPPCSYGHHLSRGLVCAG